MSDHFDKVRYLRMMGVDFTYREDGVFVFTYPGYVMEVHGDHLHIALIEEKEELDEDHMDALLNNVINKVNSDEQILP